MDKYEIIQKIEKFAPVENAESWDCVGFMIETSKIEVSKIMLCLTVTKDVVAQARKLGCDMIISHHPLFFVPLDWGDIDIYSAHTNLDKASCGTTETLIDKLGLREFVQPIEHEYLRGIDFGKNVAVEEFVSVLKQVSPKLRYVNNEGREDLRRVAFCAGSGSEFISEAKEMGFDALVTGDLKFHTALDSEIMVFDIGHFESEIIVLSELKKLIGQGVKVVYADEKNPFVYG